MSSKARKRALALQIEQGTASIENAGKHLATYNPYEQSLIRRQLTRREQSRKHDSEQEARRRSRQRTPLPTDFSDTPRNEARWDFAGRMTEKHKTDPLGGVVITDPFAGYLDNARTARYYQACAHLRIDRPTQAQALEMVLSCASPTTGAHRWPAAEEMAAVGLGGIAVSMVRGRAWKAAKILEADCVGDVPNQSLTEYMAYRRHKLRRENSRARERLWAFAVPFA